MGPARPSSGTEIADRTPAWTTLTASRSLASTRASSTTSTSRETRDSCTAVLLANSDTFAYAPAGRTERGRRSPVEGSISRMAERSGARIACSRSSTRSSRPWRSSNAMISRLVDSSASSAARSTIARSAWRRRTSDPSGNSVRLRPVSVLNSTDPSRTTSPGFTVATRRCVPLTKTPLVLPRSSTDTPPSCAIDNRACWRDRLGSSTMASASVDRPITLL